MSAWRRITGGVEIFLRVTPNAGRDAVIGTEKRGDREVLRVKVAAAPDRGKANEAVIGVLATALGLRRSAISVVFGESSRDKRVHIEGDAGTIEAALSRVTGAP